MLRVVCLPGDGIGPEVTAVAIDVLRALPVELEVEEHSFGGHAILDEGTPLPERTLAARCKTPLPRVAAPSSGRRQAPQLPPPRAPLSD